jgi:hypothetical protein
MDGSPAGMDANPDKGDSTASSEASLLDSHAGDGRVDATPVDGSNPVTCADGGPAPSCERIKNCCNGTYGAYVSAAIMAEGTTCAALAASCEGVCAAVLAQNVMIGSTSMPIGNYCP